MSQPESDPNEQANISGADFAIMCDELKTLRAELTAKKKALSSAKIALDAKDRSYSVIEQRFSAMAAKAATTDSERECNERLTAEIDALTAELAEARRQLKEASEQVPAAYCFASEIAQFNDEQFRIAQMHNRKCSNAEIALYTRAPVPQPAVPEAVAKYRHHLALLRDDCTYPAGHVGSVVLNGHRMEIIRDALSAILSATDSEVKKDGH